MSVQRSGEGTMRKGVASCDSLVEDGVGCLYPSSTLLWGSVEEEYERFVGRSWRMKE